MLNQHGSDTSSTKDEKVDAIINKNSNQTLNLRIRQEADALKWDLGSW